jgi:hypothetical protein
MIYEYPLKLVRRANKYDLKPGKQQPGARIYIAKRDINQNTVVVEKIAMNAKLDWPLRIWLLLAAFSWVSYFFYDFLQIYFYSLTIPLIVVASHPF